jgi:SHS2 domain-containing protein
MESPLAVSQQQAVSVELIEHTADIGVRVRAATPAEAFAAVAEAMFDIMVKRDQVAAVHWWTLRVSANGWESLVVLWLEELLYRYEVERIVVRTCRIQEIAPDHLVAELSGDYFNPQSHEVRLQIKAVTYHQLRAEQTAEGFEIQVIFDI